jgi:hypothetical protein
VVPRVESGRFLAWIGVGGIGPDGTLYIGSPETVAQKVAANMTAADRSGRRWRRGSASFPPDAAGFAVHTRLSSPSDGDGNCNEGHRSDGL